MISPGLTGLGPAYYRRPIVMDASTKIRIFPTGMRLHEWIAFEEGYFREQRLDPEVMWDVYLGQMKAWSGGYKARPQDQPFLEGTQAIGNACAWGSVCNAGAGMGKFVPDAYGVARHAIYVRPDSHVRRPEDLRGVPIAVGLMAGSHYNVPYRLESYLPLTDIKIEPVGGFGRRLDALLRGEVEAASLLDPQIYMAEKLAEIMAAIKRWGMGREMQIAEVDRL